MLVSAKVLITALLVSQAPTPPPPTPTPPAPTPSPAPPATPRPAPAPTPAPAPGAKGATEIDYGERQKKGKFSFDFAKAEIVDIVKVISDMTQRNFIIPEKIKSQKITILSPTKINAAEAYQVFLAALAVNGITIVRSGKFYKLVEAKEAIKDTIPTCTEPGDECPQYSDQMVTLLLHLKYVDAQQILPVLKGLATKESEITVFAPTNALIVSEFAPNLERLKKIIEALDQPGFEDELQIVQVKHATASEIADKLTQIFEVQAAGRGAAAGAGRAPKRPTTQPEGGAAAVAPGAEASDAEVQISKIIPDDRTNQLIIKANRRSFEAIQRLIDKLDVPIADGDGRINIYYLENAKAEDLASTLSSLAQGQQAKKQAGRPGGQPAGAAAPAAAVGEAALLFQGEVQISADKATNSLIIVANASDYRALVKLIDKLDVPRRQVYVEAAILEVTVTDNREFALNWHAPMRFSKDDIGDEVGPAVGFAQSAQSGGPSPTLAPLSPETLLGIAGGSLIGVLGKPLDIPLGNGESLSIPSFGVILRWLESTSTANILSTPHILTTDNEEATIEVGQRIPFQRGTSIPNLGALGGTAAGAAGVSAAQLGSLGSLFSSTDRIDVSLKLTIKPQVNERDKVRLDIDQQIEDLVGREEVTKQPITANRSAKTVIVVDDQQTVVIGGLMRDRVRQSESKIPVLGDLPLLGWLFKQQSSEVEKVNLLLVLTPYIIREAADFQEIFERKMLEHEEFAAEYYGHTPQYRAHIDYRRKSGPFALLSRKVQEELQKVENGGQGSAGEMLISPEPAPAPAVPERIPLEPGSPPSLVTPPPPAEAAPPVEAPPTEPPPPVEAPEGGSGE